MTSEKLIAFIKKLLEKTKNGEIKWKRYSPEVGDFWASSTKSFSCTAGTMRVNILSDEDFNKMEFDIIYDKSVPTVILDVDECSDEVKQTAMRLANYVYDQFPNLEKSIDQFLMEP